MGDRPHGTFVAAASRNVQLVAPWKDEVSREAGAVKSNGLDPEFAPSPFKVRAMASRCNAQQERDPGY